MSMAETLGVVPVLVGPLQALLAVLPYILLAILTAVISLFKPSVLKRIALLLWSQKLPVGLVAVAVAAAVMGGSALLGGRGGEVAAAEAGTSWPLLRGSPARRGYAGGAEPAAGNVVWAFKDDGRKIDTFYSSPAVVGNRVYATGALSEYFTDRGAVYCLDADSGNVVWSYGEGGYRATFSSPAVAEGYVVVGEGLHLTDDARVVCLDAEASERDPDRRGVKVWEYRTASHVESSPCVADGRAYVGAGDDGLYCFDLAGDGAGGPRVLWHLDGREYPDCETSPVVHDGRVYFSLGLGGQAVCCVDAATGDPIWRIPTPAPAFGSPSIAEGLLYVGMGWGDYVNDAAAAAENLRRKLADEGADADEIRRRTDAFTEVGQVWCVEAATGEVAWRFDRIGGTVLGSPAVADGRVVVAARGGGVYALSADDGRLIRRFDAHQPIVSAPAVAEEHVYAVTAAGTLYGLDRRGMDELWRVRLNAPTMSSPAVARGRVYVGSTGAGLLCVGEPAGQKAPPAWSGEGGPGGTGCADDGILAERGAYAWRIAPIPDAADDAETPVLRAPAAYLDRSLYVPASQGPRHGLARVAMGESMGDKPAVRWFAPADHAVHLSAAVTAESVYCVDGARGDAGRRLRCLDPESGSQRWSRAVDAGAGGEVRLAGALLLVADRADGITCLDTGGGTAAPLWSAGVGRTIGAPVVAGELVVQAVAEPAGVVALDLRTGVELWRQPLDEAPPTGAVWAADRAWVAVGDAVAGFSPVAGEAPVRIDTGPVDGPLVCNGRYLLAASARRGLLAVDLDSGQVARTIDGALAGLPPVLTASDEVVHFAEGAVRVVDLNSGASRHWAALRSVVGRPATAMICAESFLFYGSDTKGLICLEPRP
ncbi:MAG: PQQ-binding-like beta-propeller repeat protein [Planctomycetes bacterium]|nr:PQQ-binding-like beta-propeller repeat protein [Planctomycetota bacterium]